MSRACAKLSPEEDLVRDIVPIIPHGSSDAGALDASFELLLRTGHTLPEVKSIMIPEAWEETAGLDPRLRDFYDQAARRMGPWDGPAAICAFDGAWVLAGMDRNGLRPLRFCLTKDQLLVVGSETGMVRLDESDITQKGTVGPGQMLGVHLEEGGFYDDAALKQIRRHAPHDPEIPLAERAFRLPARGHRPDQSGNQSDNKSGGGSTDAPAKGGRLDAGGRGPCASPYGRDGPRADRLDGR